MSKKRRAKKKSKAPSLLKTMIWTVSVLLVFGLVYRFLFGPGRQDNKIIGAKDLITIVTHADILSSEDADATSAYLYRLQDSLNEDKITVANATVIQNQRYEAALHLEDIAVTEEQELAAISHQIESARGLVALQYANPDNIDAETVELLGHNDRLMKLARKYSNHPDLKIKRNADSGMLLVTVHAYTNSFHSREDDPERLGKELAAAEALFDQLVEKYQDDDAMLRTIRRVFRHWSEVDPESAIRVAAKAREKFSGQDSMISVFVQDLYDFCILESVKYQSLVSDRFTESTRSKPLLEATLKILEKPEFGARVIRQVTTTAAWYESRDDLASAIGIFQAAADVSGGLTNEKLAKGLRLLGENGLTRSTSLGKKIEIDAESTTGVRVNQQTLGPHVVLVIFWSGKVDRSLEVIRQLYGYRKDFSNQGVKVVGVSIREDVDSDAAASLKEFRDWQFIPFKQSGFSEVFPINTTPHLLVLDHEHQVARVRANLTDVLEVLKSLAAKQGTNPDASSPK